MRAAQHARITPEGLADLRSRIGVEHRLKQQFHESASRDAIRHFAHGMGDVNPLWTDADYAARSRFGGLVAPPAFLCSCGMPRSVGLPGVHALYTGSSWRFEQPVLEGARVVTSVVLRDLVEKEGAFAGRQFLEVDEAVYRDTDGQVLGTLQSHVMRTERDSAREKGKYAQLEPHTYTPEEIERIEADYDAEEIRGSTPRYWDDVEAGEPLPQIVKGPLTVTDMVGWLQGWGGMFIFPHAIGRGFRRRHPAAYTRDGQGIPDVPERVHWDSDFARAAGAPAAYDYGPQRIAWLSQLLTNWQGDAGWLSEISVEVRKLNLVGDTTWCRGEVLERSVADGEATVRCAIRCVNQRDEVTAHGEAVVQLPRRPEGRM